MLDGLRRLRADVQALRATRRGQALVLMLLLLVYTAGLLWPFRLTPPLHLTNGAHWTGSGNLAFVEPGLAVGGVPTWQGVAKQTSDLELFLRVRSLSAQQHGPARILTLSRNTQVQNLLIGQQDSALIARFAMACPRQADQRCVRTLRVKNVFETQDWVDISVRVAHDWATITIDGNEPRLWSLPAAALEVWDEMQHLALGNDVTGYRPWQGEIARAEVRRPEIRDLLAPATLALPESFWVLEREPKWIPFRDVPWLDLPINLVLFVPLALAVVWLCGGEGRRCAVFSVVAAVAASVAFESLQLFFGRNPSLTDLLMNGSGAAIAVLAWSRLVGNWPRSRRVRRSGV